MCKRERCRTPFIYPDSRTKYCSEQCRLADEKQANRKKRAGQNT
jgi:hypothetical protein